MLNQVTLIGYLGKAPEIRTTQTGMKIANFSLATTEAYKDKASNEWKKVTDWHSVTVFNPNDSLLNSLDKGALVFVTGKYRSSKYKTKMGEEVTHWGVLADKVCSLEKKPATEEKKSTGPVFDDIPF